MSFIFDRLYYRLRLATKKIKLLRNENNIFWQDKLENPFKYKNTKDVPNFIKRNPFYWLSNAQNKILTFTDKIEIKQKQLINEQTLKQTFSVGTLKSTTNIVKQATIKSLTLIGNFIKTITFGFIDINKMTKNSLSLAKIKEFRLVKFILETANKLMIYEQLRQALAIFSARSKTAIAKYRIEEISKQNSFNYNHWNSKLTKFISDKKNLMSTKLGLNLIFSNKFDKLNEFIKYSKLKQQYIIAKITLTQAIKNSRNDNNYQRFTAYFKKEKLSGLSFNSKVSIALAAFLTFLLLKSGYYYYRQHRLEKEMREIQSVTQSIQKLNKTILSKHETLNNQMENSKRI